MNDVIKRPVRVRVEFLWRLLGRVQAEGENRPLFPAAPRRPGLYRFRLRGNGPDRHYVGETDELQRRFQQYRTPGRSQRTNIRVNAEFRDHLAAGGEIEVDIVIDEIDIAVGGEPIGADLADKAIRRLLEHAALVEEAAFGTIFLNR